MRKARQKSRRIISILLTLAMLLAFVPAFPQVAGAADADVAITGTMTESAIETALQGAIDAVDGAGGGMVTVTGSKTDVSDGIDLVIPGDVNVIWQSEYSGELNNGYSNNYLISFTCSGGIFEVAPDGSLVAEVTDGEGGQALQASGYGDVLVTGGKVSVTGVNTSAIVSDYGNITITGGIVSASGEDSTAIACNSGEVKVSNGEISATGNNCFALSSESYCNVSVSGGAVSADIDGGTDACWAIYIYQGTAAIKGGAVIAFDGTGTDAGDCYAIYIEDDGAAAYLDGTVTGALDIDSSATAWIAEVATGWTGTVDTELSVECDDSSTHTLTWTLLPHALYINDNLGDHTILWDEPTYNAADIAIINGMIDHNGLAYPKAPVDADYDWFNDNWPDIGWLDSYPTIRITELYFPNYGLTGNLDLTGLTALIYLVLTENSLTGLDVSGCAALEELRCETNILSNLDVSGCTYLENIYCDENNLSSLDVSDCTALISLGCSINNLTTLDVSACVALEVLYCNHNYLEALNLSTNTALTTVFVFNNYIADKSDVDGVDPGTGWDGSDFIFDPQYTGAPLYFINDGFDIPAGYSGTAVSVDVSTGVTGGVGPYKFDINNSPLDWSVFSIDEDTGVVTGTRPSVATDATKAVIGVEDANHNYRLITITVGAVTTTPPTDVTFTAEQTGGVSGTANSTGIILTFDDAVTGLAAGDVTITNGTGAVTKGALTGSGDTWTIALASVTEEGNVTVSVADFGDFAVTTSPQTVAVYKNSVLTTPDAPAAPTLDNYDAASVTLDPIIGAEYAVNTVNNATGLVWQDLVTFDSLIPNTTYYFFARIKAVTGVSNASAASPSLEVTTDKAALGGTANITGITQYGQTLTAVTTGLASIPVGVTLGALSYQWKRGGGDISGATESSYVLAEEDIGATLTVTVAAANCTGAISSAPTVAIAKAAQAAPAVVYERTVDASDNWVVEITSPAAGAEYSTDGVTYSATNSFTFTAGTPTATIYARLLETTTHATSAASSVDIDFDKEDQEPPPAFELTYTVYNSDIDYIVTISTTATGVEYSFDGSAWSDTVNEIAPCLPGTTVTGYIRYKETTEANASSVVSASYTLPLFRVQTPTATPKSGNFKTTQDVALTCATTGASIYYTLDGTTPTTGSIPYTAPFTLTKTTTVKAIAFMGGMADSAMLSAKYTKGSNSSSSNSSEETASYIVTFNLDGGTRTGGGELSQVVRWNGSAEEPIAQREGYTFDGWDQPLRGIIVNTTITALWRPEKTDEDETETDAVDDSDAASNPANNQDNWDNPFADVNPNDWYYADVAYVLTNGLMNGIALDMFDPNSNLTRGMIVTILYRLEGEPAISGLTNIFDDVAAGQYYANAVQWAAAGGLVTGYGNGLFGANDNITRQDLAVILMRYLNYKEINLAVTAQWIMFADEGDIAGYAMDALQTLNKLGVINGVGTNEFGQIVVDPQGNATRAQTAAMLHRFLELIK